MSDSPAPAAAHGIPGLDAEGLVLREKGADTGFFPGNPDVDRLLAMITALTGEIAILRARLDTHERLAARAVISRRMSDKARAGRILIHPDMIETSTLGND